MSEIQNGETKNLIFQYMILNPDLDQKRGDIKGQSRSAVYKEIADISRKSFEIYADKVGAEYLYSDQADFIKDEYESDPNITLFECLRLIYDPWFDQFDKVAFFDTDIVANTEENIFDLCDDGEIFGVLESDIITHHGGGYNAWDRKGSVLRDYCEKFIAHDIPLVPAMAPNRPSKLTILNTGVVVWTKEARIKARERFLDWKEWYYTGPQKHMSIMNDQPYISGQIQKHGLDLVTLPDQSWNDSPHYETEEKFFEVAKMCHYTGGEWKLDMIRHYKEGRFKIFETA